jgi:autotransporter adhesin
LTSIGAAAACIAIALNMSHVTDSGKWIKEKSGQNIAKANTVKTKEASTNRSTGPLDKFMAKASDEEKTMIIYYELDEIPEY